ncbi:MAG: B12-binding domain-containing radical SAM protein [Bacteroidetes bacterium]|nr:B12-binding domain-containing radical SAM protein [Bacteroidota bacterium]
MLRTIRLIREPGMRVLLIQPGKREKPLANPFGYLEPLGLEAVAGAINEICDVGFIDMRFSTPSELENIIASEGVDACGITSSFTMDYNQTVSAAKIIKEADRRTFVFVGGHHPSMCSTDFKLPFIDAVVIGEGENTVRELISVLKEGGDPRKVAGLALNIKNEQLMTGTRPLIHDLDLLPRPDLRISDRFRKRYRLFTERSVTLLETVRGCQFKCNFCGVWKFYGGKVRMKSAERVVDEVRNAAAGNVFFVDDNFFTSAKRAQKIADLIKREGIEKRYLIQARTDTISSNPELLDKWADVGLRSAFLGFEKTTQEELDSAEKHNSVENNEKALGMLKVHGIEPVVSFIVDPEYGVNEFRQLRGYIKKLSLVLPYFTVLTPLPGTTLHEGLGKNVICHRYDLFDLLHLVMPSRLPADEFGRQFAKLYKTGYPAVEVIAGALRIFVDVLRGRLSLQDWMDIVSDWRIVTDPSTCIEGLVADDTLLNIVTVS